MNVHPAIPSSNAVVIETLTASNATNTAAITALETQVAANINNIQDRADEITALETQVADRADEITALETQVAANTANVLTSGERGTIADAAGLFSSGTLSILDVNYQLGTYWQESVQLKVPASSYAQGSNSWETGITVNHGTGVATVLRALSPRNVSYINPLITWHHVARITHEPDNNHPSNGSYSKFGFQFGVHDRAGFNNNMLIVGSNNGTYLQGGYVGHFGFSSPYSDDRLKHDETPITTGLAVMAQLSPKKYRKSAVLNDPDGPSRSEAGFIAQEVLQTDLAFAVRDGDTEEGEQPYSLQYESVFTYAVAAIKELEALVTAQGSEITALRDELTALRDRI